MHETKVINFASPLLLYYSEFMCVSQYCIYICVAVYVCMVVCVLLADGKHLRQREGWQRWVVQGQTPGQPGFPPGPGEDCTGHLPALIYCVVYLH